MTAILSASIVGTSILGTTRGSVGGSTFYATNPASGGTLEPTFHSASVAELDRATALAATAFPVYSRLSGKQRGAFLREIAAQLEAIAAEIIPRAVAESGLPQGRIQGELARTCNQLRFFAGIAEEGSWVDARIDLADAARQPAAKPDLRSMLRPLGPVAVFCASNFPLAFSVAGGDTASALAAGCPVLVNAHYSHPGAAEFAGLAIQRAAQECGLPEGVFSLLFSSEQEIGQRLVAHPVVCAVGFTGSRAGGLALQAIAATRAVPIPFYAEMSSVNPVFVLPGALAERGAQIAAGLHGSITLGAGQFCTNPGLLMLDSSPDADTLVQSLAGKMAATAPATMLNASIHAAYSKSVAARDDDAGVMTVATAAAASPAGCAASAALFAVSATQFLAQPHLQDEVFGPSSLVVRYEAASTSSELLHLVESLQGNLTATVHATDADLKSHADFLAMLEGKVGRIVFNGYPTGVEVCQAMVHGGPFPATSDSRSSSVGGRAIERFARPVCWQDAPQVALLEELRSENTLGIMRLVDGVRTRE